MKTLEIFKDSLTLRVLHAELVVLVFEEIVFVGVGLMPSR